MKEVWKCIPDYSKYIASDKGNIMLLPQLPKNDSSTVTGKTNGRYGKILSPRWTPPLGHLQVCITNDNGKRKMEYVHRLVAKAFLKKRPGKEIVLHKDDNPQNNNLTNLMWGTHFINSQMISFRNLPKTKSKLELVWYKVNTMYIQNKKEYAGKSKDLIILIAKDLDISYAYAFSLVYNKSYRNRFSHLLINKK